MTFLDSSAEQTALPARRYFMVRSDIGQIRQDRVAVGWPQIDFSQFDSGRALLSHIRERYGFIRSARQAQRFFEMREGDVVISPLSGCIVIGVVASSACQFDPIDSQAYPNFRSVHFRRLEGKLDKILRSELGTALQTRLRTPGLFVGDLGTFAQELELLLASDPDFSIRNRAAQKNSALAESFKAELLERIRRGQTYLKAGGRGFELLIQKLLEAQGYIATTLGTRGFDGQADADIRAEKTDNFSSTRLLIQAKHHRGQTGTWGLEQLRKIREVSQYDDHDLILISTATFSAETSEYAKRIGIELIDGEKLVEIILENLSALPLDIQHELGVSSTPQLLTV